MERKLTQGECEMIASALYRRGEKLQQKADDILKGAGFWQDSEGSEPSEEATGKLERLAGVLVARYKGIRLQAKGFYNLGDFIANPSHDVTVDCVIDIPEQA